MRRSFLPLVLLAATAPVLHAQQAGSFTVLRQLFPNTEGRLPYGQLVQGADGLFYGTASRGGAFDQGTVFRFDATGGSFAVLYAFSGPPGDGARPEGGLIQARDGLFYGATTAGGFNDRGLLYRLGFAGGGLQPLAAFNLGFPGATPTAQLVEGGDGALYGSAEFGGFAGFGTVFRVGVPDGGLSEVAEFFGSPDPANPAGRLLPSNAAPDGSGQLLGATLAGGFSNLGTVFSVNTDGGGRQELFSFSGNFDGSLPRALTFGPDGNTLYGLTRSGGALNFGNIFSLDRFGNFFLLYTFNPGDFSGYDVLAELLLASDGNFYGTTRRGGSFDAGTIFQVTPNGFYATLYSFSGTGFDGGYPQAALIQGNDGGLLGVAAGQQGQPASVFRVDLGLPRPRPVVRSLLATAGAVGDTVTLIGDNFVGSAGVRFSVATAALNVVSARYATVVVPAGAVTGPLTVLDAAGQPGPASAQTFTVTQVAPAPTPTNPPAVSLLTTDPVAIRGDATQPGRVRLTRAGGDANLTGQPLTVRFKVQAASTARRDVDYQLVVRGIVLPAGTNVITLPANKFTTGLEVVPLAGGGTGTVKVKLSIDPAGAYNVDAAAAKGTVSIQ